MNQSLQSRFAAELKELRKKNIAGEAVEKYLLDENNRIRIPNVIYCVLQMLEDESEDPNVLYTEYCGRCLIQNCKIACQETIECGAEFQWRFWYVRQEKALNITDVPAHSLGDEECSTIVDGEKNVIFLNIYAKLAYQCMVIYNPRGECYLPTVVFRMAKYTLFLLSHKAFLAALKSAVGHNDEEINYVIREVLETILGLKDVKKDELYEQISHMQGSEKAAVVRVLSTWGSGSDLPKGLYDIIHNFEQMLHCCEVQKLISEQETASKRVLGEELFYHMQQLCQRNKSIN